MKIFNLENYNVDTLNKFIEFSNNNWDEEWCIYINSGGGGRWEAGQIDEILDRKLKTTSSCYLNIARVYSSAFSTMMNFKGKINILYTARGLYHQSTFDMNLNINVKESGQAFSNFGEMIKKECSNELKKELEWCKTFMTDKELQDYKDGKDIYYNEKQLKAIIKNKF
jgi:hypothetical protein